MDNTIALLIDCDNISFKTIGPVMKELEQYGEVIIKRAYGNWRSDTLKNWAIKLTELSIKPIHQIDYTKGKNATDMAIVIDAMDLLHMRKVNAIALVSSDSDFTPLAMKLLEEGLKVYVFGNSGTPISLKNSCNIFTDIDSLQSKAENKVVDEKPSDKLSKSKLKDLALSVFNTESPENTEITMESFNRALKNKGIDFKNYGFKQLKVFVDDLNLFQIRINEKSQGFLKRKVSVETPNVNARSTRVELIANKDLIRCIVESYNEVKDNTKDVNLSTFYNVLFCKHGVTHKKFGFAMFKDFMYELDLFDFYTKNEQPHIKAKPELLKLR